MGWRKRVIQARACLLLATYSKCSVQLLLPIALANSALAITLCTLAQSWLQVAISLT